MFQKIIEEIRIVIKETTKSDVMLLIIIILVGILIAELTDSPY